MNQCLAESLRNQLLSWWVIGVASLLVVVATVSLFRAFRGSNDIKIEFMREVKQEGAVILAVVAVLATACGMAAVPNIVHPANCAGVSK